ncbi:hypothetical protein FACS189492_1190 [Clostridia bacterium]|nr:hypothetical protein FACS189492_1190 [Clostridia bacterium]
MSTYKLQREIPLAGAYDLIVAGGGPAGSAAAICAARLGARVLLIEAAGSMGGMGTSGLVCAFDPMADGEKMLVGGFMREVVEALYARGFMPRGGRSRLLAAILPPLDNVPAGGVQVDFRRKGGGGGSDSAVFHPSDRR